MARFAQLMRLAGAVLATAVLAAPVLGQGLDIRAPSTSPRAATGAAPAAPAPATPAPEWSGESGASNHPLMTADAIRAAAANFRSCLEGLRPQAERRGVSRAVFDANVAGLTPDLRIMDLLDAQPEFTKSFWDYLDILVNDDRIKNGQDILAKYRPTFEAVEKAYGVDRYIIAAIWGVESNYGTMVGDRSVIRSTATLACVGRRQDYFREEFLSALEILARGDVRADHLKGSWAGAFGPTQFMPTSFKRFAVDHDGDGRRDVVDSVPDALGSTANFLKKAGWVTGLPWGYEVRLPSGYGGTSGRGNKRPLSAWAAAGITRIDGRPLSGDYNAGLLLPAGANGPAFLVTRNFDALYSYNAAESYGLAIAILSERLRGNTGIRMAWPTDDPPLSRAERRELQRLLAARGHDVGEPDGKIGQKTRDAIKQIESQLGMRPTGRPGGKVLQALKGR